jgi:2-methylcitrate dehydratase PrpD
VPLGEGSLDAPGVWPAEVLVECGTERHVRHTRPYKGSPPNPFTWDEACEKFRRYAGPIVGEPRATAIIDAVGGLERAADMADVARLVALA